MFRNTCKAIRESIYGVLCQSPLGAEQVNFGNGTAFMIAPGICATAAHVLHVEGNKTKPLHQKIEVIRAPDIGKAMLQARLIAEDVDRDLALIEIINPLNSTSLTLYSSKIDVGTNCGALGFPLSSVALMNNQIAFNLVERFQGAYLSAFQRFSLPGNLSLDLYETDSVVYSGSSGCPGFTVEEKIFGMVVGTASESNSKDNSSRLAISHWVPSMDIIGFAKSNGIKNLKVT
jgi:hypothetical protein